jgi:hypothetical protein
MMWPQGRMARSFEALSALEIVTSAPRRSVWHGPTRDHSPALLAASAVAPRRAKDGSCWRPSFRGCWPTRCSYLAPAHFKLSAASEAAAQSVGADRLPRDADQAIAHPVRSYRVKTHSTAKPVAETARLSDDKRHKRHNWRPVASERRFIGRPPAIAAGQTSPASGQMA